MDDREVFENRAWEIATRAGVTDAALLKPAICRHFGGALRVISVIATANAARRCAEIADATAKACDESRERVALNIAEEIRREFKLDEVSPLLAGLTESVNVQVTRAAKVRQPNELNHSSNCASRSGQDCDCEER